MTGFTLRQLQLFSCIAKEGSLSRAAEELFMSKSAASQALTDLERRLGHALFERRNGRLFLNEAGRLLQPDAEEMLARAASIATLFSEVPQGELRLGVTQSVARFYLPQLLKRFGEEYGWLPVVTVGNTASIAHGLCNYDIDLAMVEGPVADSLITSRFWREEALIVAAGRTSPWAGQKPTWSEAQRWPWLLRESGSGSRTYFETHVRPHLKRLNVKLTANSADVLLRSAALGMGVVFASEAVLKDPYYGGAIERIEMPQRFVRPLSFCTHVKKFETPSMKAWRELADAQEAKTVE